MRGTRSQGFIDFLARAYLNFDWQTRATRTFNGLSNTASRGATCSPDLSTTKYSAVSFFGRRTAAYCRQQQYTLECRPAHAPPVTRDWSMYPRAKRA